MARTRNSPALGAGASIDSRDHVVPSQCMTAFSTVPVTETGTVENAVMHWDGTTWSRESIEAPAPSAGEFRVLAIGASSPGNAWLLAQLAQSSAYPVGAVALFRRSGAGAGATWRPVALV